jgi:hypothetical protein
MKSYSKVAMVQSDSTRKDSVSRENIYIISETQLKEINRQTLDFDSLKVRFEECRTRTAKRFSTVKDLSGKISFSFRQESKYYGLVIKNDSKIKKGLSLRNAWLTIRTPLIGAGLFYVGYRAGVNNWITLKF